VGDVSCASIAVAAIALVWVCWLAGMQGAAHRGCYPPCRSVSMPLNEGAFASLAQAFLPLLHALCTVQAAYGLHVLQHTCLQFRKHIRASRCMHEPSLLDIAFIDCLCMHGHTVILMERIAACIVSDPYMHVYPSGFRMPCARRFTPPPLRLSVATVCVYSAT
jgi:hypothetical protein